MRHLSTLVLVAALCTIHSTAFSGIRFDQRFTRTIRRSEYYEAIAGSKAYFILYYEESDALSYNFAADWSRLAEEYKDTDDVVFMQVNCALDTRLCRQQAVDMFPTLKAYQNGEMYLRYKKAVFFYELVREFIEGVTRDLLQETVE